MKYFPFFLQLDKLPCLIIGGGTVAERKIDLLIKANADITIVSIEFTDYILEVAKKIINKFFYEKKTKVN